MKPDTDDEYQVQSDASTLKNHAEITSDPPRHAKALAHMQNDQVTGQQAIDNSHKQLRQKVKKGLKKAFPTGGAGASSDTPFQKAAKGE